MYHRGIDIKANYEPVYSVLDGVVKDIGVSNTNGRYIKITHYNKFETIYLHLSKIYYAKNDIVKAGDVIAQSGNSGLTTGPHLHFAVKENNKFIDPLKFLIKLFKIITT